ncbi:MAG: AAA family ATPase [Azospirillum sp.]|nr:AAA family ATPase [Azospirillum sp.]
MLIRLMLLNPLFGVIVLAIAGVIAIQFMDYSAYVAAAAAAVLAWRGFELWRAQTRQPALATNRGTAIGNVSADALARLAASAAADASPELPKRSLDDVLFDLTNMTGLASVKSRMVELVKASQIEAARRAHGYNSDPLSLHLAFEGPPGTGKTTIAALVGEIYAGTGLLKRGHVVSVARADLVGGFMGQTAEKTKQKIVEALDGVLFVDEVHQLAAGGDQDYGREALRTLVAEMENNRDRLAVIFAGYELDSVFAVDAGLRGRFASKPVVFDNYTPAQLVEILMRSLKRSGMRLDRAAENAAARAVRTLFDRRDPATWANAREIRNFSQAIRIAQSNRIHAENRLDDRSAFEEITAADIDAALKE